MRAVVSRQKGGKMFLDFVMNVVCLMSNFVLLDGAGRSFASSFLLNDEKNPPEETSCRLELGEAIVLHLSPGGGFRGRVLGGLFVEAWDL